MKTEKENITQIWLKDSGGKVFRPLTKKEKLHLKKMDVSEETKKEIGEIWGKRDRESKSPGRYSFIGYILQWFFAFVFFLVAYDQNSEMFNLGFDYYESLVLPLEKIFVWGLSIISVVASVFFIIISIFLRVAKRVYSDSIDKEDVANSFWYSLLKRNKLKKVQEILLSVLLIFFLIMSGHGVLAFLILLTDMTSIWMRREMKNLAKHILNES